MRNHIVRVAAATFVTASVVGVGWIVGCGALHEAHNPNMATGPNVNTEVARQLSENAAQQTDQTPQLRAGDRFGVTVHERYVKAVQEANGTATVRASGDD